MPPDAESESYVRGGLDGDEIRILGHANNGAFAVTDRRLIVGGPAGVGLDIPFATVRRIQFDLDPGRPASVAFVSNDPHDEVVLLSIHLRSTERSQTLSSRSAVSSPPSAGTTPRRV